jgi:hypothetical protein
MGAGIKTLLTLFSIAGVYKRGPSATWCAIKFIFWETKKDNYKYMYRESPFYAIHAFLKTVTYTEIA